MKISKNRGIISNNRKKRKEKRKSNNIFNNQSKHLKNGDVKLKIPLNGKNFLGEELQIDGRK